MVREPDAYEAQAGVVVAEFLGVNPTWWDTGKTPRQPDWTWETQVGRAFLEVTRDVDPAVEAQYSAFAASSYVMDVPTLEHGWWVVAGPRSRVSELHAVLPVLRQAEIAGLDAVSDRSGRIVDSSHPAAWVDGVFDRNAYNQISELQQQLMDDLGRMHVEEAHVVASLAVGQVRFSHPSFGAFNPGADAIVDWLDGFLVARPTDIAKLADTQAAERHLYIYANALSENLMFPLWLSATEMPTRGPVMPEGMTHVWVSGNTQHPRILMYGTTSAWIEVRPYGDPSGDAN